MIIVKIQEAKKYITIPGPLGVKHTQENTYLQLVYAADSSVVPDDIYRLQQGEEEFLCNVTRGHLRGAERLDRENPIYLPERVR